jgi:hypothetical protein
MLQNLVIGVGLRDEEVKSGNLTAIIRGVLNPFRAFAHG